MEKAREHIETALGAMATSPRNLRAYLAKPGPDFDEAPAAEIDYMIDLLLAVDPNDPARLRFSDRLSTWDNTKDATWTDGTPRNTAARRKRIHQLLKSGSALESRIDTLLPFILLPEPLIISEVHTDWYAPAPGRDYYWTTYRQYLKDHRAWTDKSLLSLDNSTRAIIECLANPESRKAYAARGLVMGYVQSGKTANFAGVAARAADAGYRLIIIMAGTWNILRDQTQRRLDKELLGKEMLLNDESYLQHPPDWDDFLEHGFDPADRGHFRWQRLTRPAIDFKNLKAAIDTLEFDRRSKAVPLYHHENLHALPVKLLVVKKHSGILKNLLRNLKLLQTKLTDLPALIIDDESDQAGLNTRDPRKKPVPGDERSRTNDAIVQLLELLPRGQYVGYTATPYANALVNPDDSKDLFPKDFIVSLDRPVGYMGIADFFDPTVDQSDLPEGDFTEPENAFIRRVDSPRDQDDEDLKKSLRSYILSGAIKLYRLAKDPCRYSSEYFRHHTMLIHTSWSMGQHAFLAAQARNLWDQCAFNSPKGLAELEKLWKEDYALVSAAQGNGEIVPSAFAQLIPHLTETIQRIMSDQNFIRVVNSDKKDAPDFSAGPVWKIVIGGNNLSRGYTIEGLTVSYYRRQTSTADTLMQMGRWFGFRPGYRDLVRVYLGVREGKSGQTDLVALFKEVCRMEEQFREEIRRYVRRPGAPRITPKQIPPLISVTGNLPPTARNKMFHAKVASKNFGGRWSMPTLTAAKPADMDENIKSLGHLLSAAKSLGTKVLGGQATGGKKFAVESVLFDVSNEKLIEFLKAYRWLDSSEFKHQQRPVDLELQIEFLETQKHGISSWLIVAPQRKTSFGNKLTPGGAGPLTVKERARVEEGGGFKVFGESIHRTVAEHLAGVTRDPDRPRLESPNDDTKKLQSRSRGVFLLYPVRQQESDRVSVGFELLVPENQLPFDVSFTVRKTSEAANVVVGDETTD